MTERHKKSPADWLGFWNGTQSIPTWCRWWGTYRGYKIQGGFLQTWNIRFVSRLATAEQCDDLDVVGVHGHPQHNGQQGAQAVLAVHVGRGQAFYCLANLLIGKADLILSVV